MHGRRNAGTEVKHDAATDIFAKCYDQGNADLPLLRLQCVTI
jgi:hypothetical protein